MHKTWEITKGSFEKLLLWLDADPDNAAIKYEAIRRSLLKMFAARGCSAPEELTDDTINRVAKRISEIGASYSGEPTNYFYGVARKVLLESRRRPGPLLLEPTHDIVVDPKEADVITEHERDLQCLEECLDQLPAATRLLITKYYSQARGNDSRMELAKDLGIPLNALRVKAFRTRKMLEDCILNCVERKNNS
jgi:RNA polymerase sigma factor (sigma-70 family)